MSEKKYIRIFDDAGDWIDRPDFMVYAVMSETEAISAEHTYSSMLLEERLNPPTVDGSLSQFAKRLKEKTIESNLKRRSLAGAVVLEMARLCAANGKPPSVNAARRLVAYNHHKHFQVSSPQSLEREVQQSFSMFRNTAHFHAVSVLEPSLLSEIEGDVIKFKRFLGLTRAFEDFIDNNVVSKAFKWDPLRVPKEVDIISTIRFPALTGEEISIALKS